MSKQRKDNLEKATEICKKHVKKLDLPMNIIGTEYLSKQRKIVFKFEANRRVDFRKLLKILQRELSVKIELRQIGPRDRAKDLGGIGPCGEVCCCKRFLNKFESISVKLIRKQNLPCSPQKYTGYCGKLICCLKYELNNKKSAPKSSTKKSRKKRGKPRK